MKILETDQGWAVEHDGKSPIKVEGERYFPDKTVLISIIESKGRFVWSDGSIQATVEDSSGAPPTQDPPTDPNAQPSDPDPNPTSPEPVTTKEDFASGGVLPEQTEESLARLNMHKGDNIVRPEFIEAVGGKETVEKLAKAAKAKPKKAPVKKKPAESAEEPAKPRRGRPPKYTPEEREIRRKEQAKRYAAERTPEQKAAARERARRWRENNPDKVKKAREKSMEKRTQRYQTDPEFRQQVNEYQRTYKRSKREVAE